MRNKRLAVFVLIAVGTGTGNLHADTPEPCRANAAIFDNTTLADLSSFWFGNTSYRFAIMLATNARTADSSYSFISNPSQLKPGSNLCIPQLVEAETLRNRYEVYLDAISDMAIAEPSEVVNDLVFIPSGESVSVVTWMRDSQAAEFRDVEPGTVVQIHGDTWVTVVPHLQNFCRKYTTSVSDNADALTFRLEQRLGMPPAAGKTIFATFRIAKPDPTRNVFRPCGDWEISDTTCEAGIEGTACPVSDQAICDKRSAFLFRQYYDSYGQSHPVEYPWTSLGYTFDWANGPVGLGGRNEFVVQGESEFVIPAKTTVEFVGLEDVVSYCSEP